MPDLFAAPVEVLNALTTEMPSDLHPTLVEMAEEMYLHLVEDAEVVQKLGLGRVAELVVGQVDRVATKVGGAGFYLPKGIGAKLSARDQIIAARFNGRNQRELAREYNLCEIRIDQIVKKHRAAEFARRQGRLDIDQGTGK